MKASMKNHFLLPALIAGVALILAGRVMAQTFTTLYSFTADSPGNSDGAFPEAGLLLSGNTLYGTAFNGDSSGNGTVFAVMSDGTGFRTLYSFIMYSDGAAPRGGLTLSGNTLYGTTELGGSCCNGTVFAVNTDGTGFTNLHRFTATSGAVGTNSDGASPSAGLVLSANTLYGTAIGSGSAGNGSVFALNTDGTGFINLHSFTATSGPNGTLGTNIDGGGPSAALILSGNTL